MCNLHSRKATLKTYISCPDFRYKMGSQHQENGNGDNKLEMPDLRKAARCTFSPNDFNNRIAAFRQGHSVYSQPVQQTKVTSNTAATYGGPRLQSDNEIRGIITSSSVTIEKYISLSDSLLDLQLKIKLFEQEIQFVIRYIESFWPGDVMARDALVARLKSLLAMTEAKDE